MVEEALHIDKYANTDFWYKPIQKEIFFLPAFRLLKMDETMPIVYKWIPYTFTWYMMSRWILHTRPI